MPKIAIDNELFNTVQLFGKVESVVKQALLTYITEQGQQRLQQAVTHLAHYQQQYQSDYDTFKQAVQTNEAFLKQLEAQYPLWEADAMEWEYWREEYRTWRNHLQAILAL
jgi:translation initiation factor 2 alpha subunit (eIF-2alpha)